MAELIGLPAPPPVGATALPPKTFEGTAVVVTGGGTGLGKAIAAEFARLGGLHRNTFLNSPKLLDGRLRLKADPRLAFAGQITGVEGYVESAATGLITGRMLAAAEWHDRHFELPPATTAHGALVNHVTGGHIPATDGPHSSFQPMNVNFGLFPPVKIPAGLRHSERQIARKRAYTSRALADFDRWLGRSASIAAE